MKIDCISDCHGFYPQLKGGDLLIVAGDLTGRDHYDEYCKFYDWLDHQNYKEKIFICGNHDGYIQKEDNDYLLDLTKLGYDKAIYLSDSGIELYGFSVQLKVWGSPWTKTFPEMNPSYKAFTVDTDEELAEKWAMIPQDIDILITHSPPHGILDQVNRYNSKGKKTEHVGSLSLRNMLMSNYFTNLKLHVFGHIHEQGGKVFETTLTKFINASYVNEVYEPVNKPIRIIL